MEKPNFLKTVFFNILVEKKPVAIHNPLKSQHLGRRIVYSASFSVNLEGYFRGVRDYLRDILGGF